LPPLFWGFIAAAYATEQIPAIAGRLKVSIITHPEAHSFHLKRRLQAEDKAAMPEGTLL